MFRKDFLIRQRVCQWTIFFFLRYHGCNSHMWLIWAKENWIQMEILQLEILLNFSKKMIFCVCKVCFAWYTVGSNSLSVIADNGKFKLSESV